MRFTNRYDGRRYERIAWKDEEGGVWVKFGGQYNLLDRLTPGIYAMFVGSEFASC